MFSDLKFSFSLCQKYFFSIFHHFLPKYTHTNTVISDSKISSLKMYLFFSLAHLSPRWTQILSSILSPRPSLSLRKHLRISKGPRNRNIWFSNNRWHQFFRDIQKLDTNIFLLESFWLVAPQTKVPVTDPRRPLGQQYNAQ